MHFLFNLSLPPWTLALINDQGDLQDIHSWEDLKGSSEIIWNWIAEHKSDLEGLKSVRSISGPGGFSSLRVAGLIGETLAQTHKAELRVVRADRVAEALLSSLGVESQVVLNAFGQNVFKSTGEEDLELIAVEDIPEQFPEKIFTGFLPQDKSDLFPQPIHQDFTPEPLIQALFTSTENTAPMEHFVPYYGHPGVN